MCVSINKIIDKIRTPQYPVILFELIPPPAVLDPNDYTAYAECVVEVILNSMVTVNAINIPEIREEQREGARTYSYFPKGDPRELGVKIKEICNGQLNVIVNRCTVYEPFVAQVEWLKQTYEHYKLSNVILVGGDCSTKSYIGPSVNEMARYISQHYQQRLICGGIAIATRRHHDGQLDEPQRMLDKINAGIEYFTTQIIYDSDSINKLLLDYNAICLKHNIEPRRVMLSFAPVSTDKDITFMEWLGVKFPSQIKSELLKSNIAVGWRSLKHSRTVLKSILEFTKKHQLRVPLGINIEHINTLNFMLSKQFIDELGAIYVNFVEAL